jgi:hypothetical protein
MITIEDIKNFSKEHKLGAPARHTRLRNGLFEFSIVGGVSGLYGDFEETFELAIFDLNGKNFITNLVLDDVSDDVVGYMSKERLLELVNRFFKEGDFQVL